MNIIADVFGQIRGDVRNEQMLRGSLSVPQNIKHDNDYEKLHNQPQINGNTLIKNKTSSDLGLQDAMEEYTNLDILKLWNKF